MTLAIAFCQLVRINGLLLHRKNENTVGALYRVSDNRVSDVSEMLA